MTQDDTEAKRVERLPEWADLWQTTIGWQPNAIQQAQFQQLYALILQGNQRLNLTRITTPEDFWEKHLWDSLRGIQQFLVRDTSALQDDSGNQPGSGSALKAIDIGTGAGFPGLPIAIAQPHWTLTLLDSTRKKLQFIDQALADLQLDRVQTLLDRVEGVGQQPHQRQTYDLVLIRAVAAATVCAEYALPLLKIGGFAVLYRGQWSSSEATALATAAAALGGEIAAIAAFKTPLTASQRHCIYLKKIAATPDEFPRAVGIPAQFPIASA